MQRKPKVVMQRHCCSVRLECREISKKDDDEEKLFLFVQNQKVMGAQELARVEISSTAMKKLLKDSEKLKGPQQVLQWDSNYFPTSFPLIPRGQIWITAVPVEDEYHGYAELTGC
eukprot:s109_g13.t1